MALNLKIRLLRKLNHSQTLRVLTEAKEVRKAARRLKQDSAKLREQSEKLLDQAKASSIALRSEN